MFSNKADIRKNYRIESLAMMKEKSKNCIIYPFRMTLPIFLHSMFDKWKMTMKKSI
jgi:hypothetical protein